MPAMDGASPESKGHDEAGGALEAAKAALDRFDLGQARGIAEAALRAGAPATEAARLADIVATAARRKGDGEATLVAALDAARRHAEAGDRTKSIEAWIEAASTASALDRKDEAIAHVGSALAATEPGDPIRRRLLVLRASFLLAKDDLEALPGALAEAEAVLEPGDDPGLALLHELRGTFHLRREEFDPALAHLRTALRHVRRTGNRPLELHVRRRIAGILLRRGEADAAFGRLKDILVLAQEVGDTAGAADTLLQLADIAATQRRPEARSYTALAFRLNQDLGNRQGALRAALMAGRTHLQEGAGTRGLAAVEAARLIAVMVGDEPGRFAALGLLFHALISVGENASAFAALHEARELARPFSTDMAPVDAMFERLRESLGEEKYEGFMAELERRAGPIRESGTFRALAPRTGTDPFPQKGRGRGDASEVISVRRLLVHAGLVDAPAPQPRAAAPEPGGGPPRDAGSAS